jgi:hypothetical protein
LTPKLIRLLLADAIAIEMLFTPGAIFVCAYKGELRADEMINNNGKSKRDTFIILQV